MFHQALKAQPVPVSVPSKARCQSRRDRFKPRPTWRPLTAASLTDVVARFRNTEIICKEDARGVVADISAAEHRLQLSALAWTEDILPVESALSLLLVLSPIENSYLPIDTELTVTENNLLHSGQNLRWANNPTCLYTQVFGDWEKQFTVQVTLPSGAGVALPPLAFSQT